jgi:hypothetical protein
VALQDPYFIEYNLYPNVDFYSGIVLRAIGIPTNMFTVMFAIGRLPGWIAQWKESMDDPQWRISRPRQIYTGPRETHYVPIERRMKHVPQRVSFGNANRRRLIEIAQGSREGELGRIDHQGVPGLAHIAAEGGKGHRNDKQSEARHRGHDSQWAHQQGIGDHAARLNLWILELRAGFRHGGCRVTPRAPKWYKRSIV